MIRRIGYLTLSVITTLSVGMAASAAETGTYPSKPVEFVVPFSAGGGSDIMARMLVKTIGDNNLMSQPLVVINKPGGSGAIGYAYTAEKKGDPYSIATVSSSFYTMPLLGKSPVSYKDFTPICGLAMDTLLLIVKEDAKYRSVTDIIADAKARPGTLTVGGTSGTSDDAVMFYALQDRAGIKMKYVPFNSGGEVTTALLGGHVDMIWANPGEAQAQIEAKKARPLSVASSERLKLLPGVSTLKEVGIDLVLAQFRGLVAPKDIPDDARRYLEGVCEKASAQTQWSKDYLEAKMLEGRYMNSQDFARSIVDTTKMYEEFLSKIGK